MKQKLKNNKGITLVALVITIIVLLILAMVSIKIAMDGGLIGKSNEAVTIHEEAKTKESVQLAVAQCYMTKEGLTAENLKKALKENGIEESKIGNIDIANGKVTIDGKEYELEEKKNNNNGTTEAKDYSYTEEEKKQMLDGGDDMWIIALNDDSGSGIAITNKMKVINNIDPDTGSKFSSSYSDIELLICIAGYDYQKSFIIPMNEETAKTLQSAIPSGGEIEVGKCYSSYTGSEFEYMGEYTGKSPISKSDFTAEQIYCESYLDRIISNLNS